MAQRSSISENYYNLCREALQSPQLQAFTGPGVSSNLKHLESLRRAAEIATQIHECAKAADPKHRREVQNLADHVTQYIGTYFANWRLLHTQLGENTAIISANMMEVLDDILKCVGKHTHQPSASAKSSITIGSRNNGDPNRIRALMDSLKFQDSKQSFELRQAITFPNDLSAPPTAHVGTPSNQTTSSTRVPQRPRHQPTIESASDEDEPKDIAELMKAKKLQQQAVQKASKDIAAILEGNARKTMKKDEEDERQKPEAKPKPIPEPELKPEESRRRRAAQTPRSSAQQMESMTTDRMVEIIDVAGQSGGSITIKNASQSPQLLAPVGGVSLSSNAMKDLEELRRAAEIAMKIHESAKTADPKHRDEVQNLADHVTRYIGTYCANWRLLQVRLQARSNQNRPILPGKMMETLRDISKFVDKFQPSPTAKSSSWSIPKGSGNTSRQKRIPQLMHDLQQHDNNQLPELREPVLDPGPKYDLPEPATANVIHGVQNMSINKPNTQTTSSRTVGSTNKTPHADLDPRAPVPLVQDRGSQWTQHRTTVDSASDEDEPADYAEARKAKSLHAQAIQYAYDRSEATTREPAAEKPSSEGKKRKVYLTSEEETEQSEDERSRRSRRYGKKPARKSSTTRQRYNSGSDDGSEYPSDNDEESEGQTRKPTRRSANGKRPRKSKTPEPESSPSAPQSGTGFVSQVMAAVTKGGAPINLNNIGNTYGGNYNYISTTIVTQGGTALRSFGASSNR
ncbi:hypothetical protein CVT24_010052 [Panaeolus cyanescens]|uniref:Uncharacterized protein n=1 Tax=Panaeolus cyanescens TaxID=181874 RepID=A0A409YW95_9AGAR|nr:hypothetical protein CVT24_010052 [Panaeolus cyanescens]